MLPRKCRIFDINEMLLIVHLTLVKCDLIVFWECQEGNSAGEARDGGGEGSPWVFYAATGLVVVVVVVCS